VIKLIEAAQARWRAVNAPHLVALVRAGARFEKGKLVERPDESRGDQQSRDNRSTTLDDYSSLPTMVMSRAVVAAYRGVHIRRLRLFVRGHEKVPTGDTSFASA
jgi:hypothetical protein